MARNSIKDGRKGSFGTRSNGRTNVKSISGGNEKDCVKRADDWIRNYNGSVKRIVQNSKGKMKMIELQIC
ncbi:MAG: hypothetical protein K6B42_07205 [Clostridia bacterium]|nr:hypothetical protein [Clostridia bacterium]